MANINDSFECLANKVKVIFSNSLRDYLGKTKAFIKYIDFLEMGDIVTIIETEFDNITNKNYYGLQVDRSFTSVGIPKNSIVVAEEGIFLDFINKGIFVEFNCSSQCKQSTCSTTCEKDKKNCDKKQTNDGRSTCYICGKPVKQIDTGFFYIGKCTDNTCESNK